MCLSHESLRWDCRSQVDGQWSWFSGEEIGIWIYPELLASQANCCLWGGLTHGNVGFGPRGSESSGQCFLGMDLKVHEDRTVGL